MLQAMWKLNNTPLFAKKLIFRRLIRGYGDEKRNIENKQDRTIFALDMSALVAGAKFRGEFEERLQAVLNEIKKSEGNISSCFFHLDSKRMTINH